jgi:hypothetical protein
MPTRTPAEKGFLERLEELAQQSQTSFVEKITNAALWMPRQNLARLLAQWELWKLIQDVHGAVIECGVCFGGGLGAWQHFSAITEPYGHVRRCVGFDTFSGFPGMGPEDAGAQSGLAYAGGMAAPVAEEIRALLEAHSTNRPIGHIPRAEIVVGDACETIPAYVREHQHLVIAALVLDFDIAAPTRTAIECFVPLMPRGGVVIFDELNCADWVGETVVVRESGLLKRGLLRRFPYVSTMSYLVLE